MFEILEKVKVLTDGSTLVTYQRKISRLNILEIEAGTTGICGGDSGHGGRTYFRIEDLGGTDITVNKIGDGISNGGVEVILGGDSELETIIEGLKFIIQALEDGKNEKL